MGIQNSINSAIGSVGQMAAIGKAVKTYGEEHAIKQAERKAEVLNEQAAIQDESKKMETEEAELGSKIKEAEGRVAEYEQGYAQALQSDPYTASDANLEKAKSELNKLQGLKKVQIEDFKKRKEILSERKRIMEQKADIYKVKLEGGKK